MLVTNFRIDSISLWSFRSLAYFRAELGLALAVRGQGEARTVALSPEAPLSLCLMKEEVPLAGLKGLDELRSESIR